ncbi:acetyl esterase/lipase [Microbacterium sp. W4I4]|uniref:alpha/beta hydrolase n=1 Tax=Microbacterium sp. W4I4 TaxID=3042295 RepID=UPI00277DC061|nr:alpha/beta hydrolase [Microbacterium sp. W4I4]MDQ0614366.1 acetyl esterase/lipase [Microbacterium sp. W4I4]
MMPGPGVAAPLREGLQQLAASVPTDVETDTDIQRYRGVAADRGTTAEALAVVFELDSTSVTDEITSFRPSGGEPMLRAVFLHGGGLMAGNRFDGVDVLLRHSDDLDLEVWTVDYPLVPEARFDTMVSAGVAAVELAAHGGLPIVLVGQSAGGGLAAAVAFECRDRGVRLDALMLVCPMLDARSTASAAQFDHDPSWSTISNATAWKRATEGTATPVPGDRTDVGGVPPVYLDVGSAEVFRDSTVDFAAKLWADGVSAELHVWSGGFHGFDCAVEDARVSRESHRARREWLRRWSEGEL